MCSFYFSSSRIYCTFPYCCFVLIIVASFSFLRVRLSQTYLFVISFNRTRYVIYVMHNLFLLLIQGKHGKEKWTENKKKTNELKEKNQDGKNDVYNVYEETLVHCSTMYSNNSQGAKCAHSLSLSLSYFIFFTSCFRLFIAYIYFSIFPPHHFLNTVNTKLNSLSFIN